MKPPAARPLDEGARDGTEIWREIRGISFCHWDRWLLRLALDEPDGLESIGREFRQRNKRSVHIDATAEAMLAQLADLEARLELLTLDAATVLDDIERSSQWLRDKAFRRVWHAKSAKRTLAMTHTPRRLLSERARCGYWEMFPVSPAPYASELSAIIGHGWYDHRATGLVVTLLDTTSERRLRGAKHDDERLAIHRAVIKVAIDAMDQVDDSLAQLAMFFEDHESKYFALLLDRTEVVLFRDLIELVAWEDYGLFGGIENLLMTLREHQADMVLRCLANLIAELRRAYLQSPLDKALRLRRTLVTEAKFLAEQLPDHASSTIVAPSASQIASPGCIEPR